MNKAARILVKKAKKLEAKGNYVDAIAAYEAALNESPDNPDILFALGNVAKRMDMLPVAEQMFRAVYGLLPDSIEAATNLALVINDQDRTDEAVDIYKAILTQHPEHVGTWINIGNAVMRVGDIENAEIFYREALRLKRGSMEALTNLSELNAQKGDFAAALEFIDKAVRRDKRNPVIRYNRGEILLAMGKLEQGWKDLDFGAQNRKDRQMKYHHKLKRWNGEDLTGKGILLSCEQGIGDQVRFLNCVEDMIEMADQLVIETEPRLVDILARTYPEVTVRASDGEKIANVTHFNYDWPVNELDFAINMLGAYRYLKNDIGVFERLSRYFVTDPALDAKWAKKVGKQKDGYKVGICWRGGKRSRGRDIHYSDILEWGPILKQKNITFFNLMYDECGDEVAAARSEFGVELVGFEELDYKNDIDDVFALTKQMDMVISANSAPACFAGVLGIPTYMPQRNKGWDMLGTDHMAMVPAMKPIVQCEKGNWAPVIDEIACILKRAIAR